MTVRVLAGSLGGRESANGKGATVVNNWEFVSDMDHGIGVDVLTGGVRGGGVVDGELTRAGGPTVTFVVEQIEALDDLQRAVHGDTAVAAPHLGLTRATGRAGFSRRCHFNRYSAYLMIRVTATHSFRELRDPVLTARAKELLTDGEWFRNEFGDAYVRGIVAGAQLYGLIEFATATDEQQQAIAGSLDTVGGTFANAADLATSLAKSWVLTGADVPTRVTVFQPGGDARPAADAAALIDRVLGFDDALVGQDVAYSVLLGDYGQLDPAPRGGVDLAPARQALRRAVRIRNEILTQLEDIDYYLSHRRQFQPVAEADRIAIEQASRTLTRQLHDVTRAASRCAMTVRDCLSASVEYPAYRLPDRKGVLTMPRPGFSPPRPRRPATGFGHAWRLVAAGAPS
jgi:hypothetical protein